MNKITEIIRKFDPILRKFRVQFGAGIALVALMGLVALGGEPSKVTTSNLTDENAGATTGASDDTAGPADQTTAVPGELATTGNSTTVAKKAAPPQVVFNKGGLTISSSAGGVPTANLFTAAEDRIGITDTGGLFGKGSITLCGHAATSLGSAFNTSSESLDVYWKWLNATQKGVHGRNVLTSWEDDAYDPNVAALAAQRCKDKNPFLLLGGIGFEQIPQVRNFAETNRMPYLHHIARSDLTKKFSFAGLPTVELTGTRAGEWVKKMFPTKKVGIIYRDSEYWIPGKDAFKKAIGNQFVIERPVFKNQGNYNQDLLLVQQAGADLVFAWENALAQTLMIQEAKQQKQVWNPQWVVFPFNLVTDRLGEDALTPVIHGISTWAAYTPGDYSGPFADYADEIKRFEAAYRQYDPTAANAGITDIHWMVWLAWRAIHYTFDQCGRDCTRNKVIGIMVSRPFPYSESKPGCPTDFTRNGHEGGYSTSTFEAYKSPSGLVGWRPIQHCQEGWK